MSRYHGGDADVTAEDYEMADQDDDIVEDFEESAMSDSESDDEEYNPSVDDISAAQVRDGRDIQGILWDRLITRERYRQTRLDQYKNYENVPDSGEESEKDCKATARGGKYYEFHRSTTAVRSSYLHFQLRNLVWATSKHDVYLMSHNSILHWLTQTSEYFEVINVAGHVAPCEKYPGSLLEGFSRTRVTTMAVKDKLLVAGGFQGELICKHLDRKGISFCCRTTHEDDAITNSVQIYDSSSGSVHFMVASNDWGVRDFDMERYQLCRNFHFEWPVNHTSLSPDGKLIVVVGDNPEGLLVDAHTGKTVGALHGHLDYSFSTAWSPDGQTFATGNQDKTCRIWDIRNLSKSLHVVRGKIGAIRSIRFTSDGRFMAMAEPADFIHIFDVGSGYNKRQELDFFGEIAGMSFSPDTEALFVGVSEQPYGSLLLYHRIHDYSYLDSML